MLVQTTVQKDGQFNRTVPQDFLLQVFFIFPLAPEYLIKAVSIFFLENSRRYSQLKVEALIGTYSRLKSPKY